MGGTELRELLRTLLLEGKYSDLSITCGGQIFRVHRAIVCSQSPFFDAAISHGFQEAARGIICLPDDEIETIERVLSYLYLQDYEQEGHNILWGAPAIHRKVETPNSSEGSLEFSSVAFQEPPDIANIAASPAASEGTEVIGYNNLRVYLAADKFSIPPLKRLAKERFATWANENWDCETFPQVVRSVYTTTPPHEPELCDIVVGVISTNIKALVQREDILGLIEGFGALASALLKKVVNFQTLSEEQLRNSETERRRLIGVAEDSSFGELAHKINSRQSCRHCKVPFNLRVENASLGWGTLRCARCRTSH